MRRLAILLLALAACQTVAGSATEVELYEFGIDAGVTTLEAGTVVLTVTNGGEYPHTLVITDSGGDVVSAGGVVAPGETASQSVEMGPGDYSFTCRIVSQDDEGNVIDHFEEGMTTGVTVS